MKVCFDPAGWDDYVSWEADRKGLARLNSLITEACRQPFTGRGKPEPLKRDLKGYWSRRIDSEHRLVYRVTGVGDDQQLIIVQCRFHYDD